METEYPVATRLAVRESSKDRQRRSQALGTKKEGPRSRQEWSDKTKRVSRTQKES